MTYTIHPAGTLIVQREGAYLHFHASAPMQPGLLRLWLSGGGRCEALGVMQPRDGRLCLDRRLSRRELARFPSEIERAELAEKRPSPEVLPKPEDTIGDIIWYRNPDGSLNAEIDGIAYIALPASLRRPSPCARKIDGRDYVIFPAASCKSDADDV